MPCAGPAEFLELWNTQLARNGVFVEADEARPINSAVELKIITPHGEVSLDALIVHCSAGPNGAGVGLQLQDMGAELKQALVAYGEGRARALPGPRAPDGASEDGDVDAAVAQARRLLDQLGTGDIYRALDIAPEATDTALRDRIAAIGRLMSGAAGRAPPQKAARIDAAVVALTKLSQALGDPLRRLEHDLSHGFVRADARLAAAAAGTGPSAADLRAMWQRVAPERAARATAQSRDAFAAQGRGDNAEALRLARAALNDNPFLDELRTVMRTWEKSGDDLPTRRARSQSTTRARR